MRISLLITLLFLTLFVSAQTEKKRGYAVKAGNAPLIDGILNDEAWSKARIVDDFKQSLPLYDLAPSFKTEVRILYTDRALFIGAQLWDPSPDSILKQLGNRDEENMNADYFGIEFDTYNNQLDAYSFIVTAAGVQIDFRESDETYNGVWTSAVAITSTGWSAEMMIPYSAIRFPVVPSQVWGLQLLRSVRRFRENDQWSLEKPGVENSLIFWGELHGIEKIEPPLRLSVSPYLSIAAEHFPNDAGKDFSSSFGGGMDLKYGLNESYTLDMTLLPDFSQVQSDNKIKNLSAFETVYSEQRPFFNEAVDLFTKGGLFYSRRIGKIPEEFYSVVSQLKEGERIVKNPVQQQLLNATKFSGRSKSGLAIGLLNAATANTYAIIEDASGNQRKYITDPATNYNLLVLNQALKNNSEIFITNTNVIRSKGYDDANATAFGLKLNNRSNTYSVSFNGSVSQNYSRIDSADNQFIDKLGYNYYTGFGKTSGNFQFSIQQGVMNPMYNVNAMGLTYYNNYSSFNAIVAYNIYKPFWLLRDMGTSLTFQNENNFTTKKVQEEVIKLNSFCTTLKYLTLWLNASKSFKETYDYYEPRISGRYYLSPESFNADFGFSSDYRKSFALDGSFLVGTAKRDNTRSIGFSLHPIVRVSDHMQFDYTIYYDQSRNNFGFVDIRDIDSVVFGRRDLFTLINTFNGKYIFRNNLSINAKARHYWSKGFHNQYYHLTDDGTLADFPGYQGMNDFNSNYFNVDLTFNWIFAPGSNLSIVWKNAINREGNDPATNFLPNLKNTFDSPQQNSISCKILYYIDYQQIKKLLKR